ncbi:MAG: amino acid transporter ATPase [Acidimicrobiia bacterium]|nr:amino acid transporter ATPase [Acidimicrobiia bacterium]
MDSILKVDHLRLGYGDLTVIWDVSLEVRAGRTTALVGRNGAGKTTILSGIAGLLKSRSGTVELLGKDVTKMAPWNRIRGGLGVVQEGKRVMRTLTVQENLTLALNNSQFKRSEYADASEEMYTRFPVLGGRRTERAGALSGGQQQMLAIAQALIPKPSVLLIDEPSSGLAPIVVHEILGIIDQLKVEGIGILLVEQLLEEVLSGVADDVVLIERGRVLLADKAENLTLDQLAEGIFR